MSKETEIFRYRSRTVALTTFQLLANSRAFYVVSSHESFALFKLVGRLWQIQYLARPSLSYSSCIMSYTMQQRVLLVRTYWVTGPHRVIQTEHRKKFGGRKCQLSPLDTTSPERSRKWVLVRMKRRKHCRKCPRLRQGMCMPGWSGFPENLCEVSPMNENTLQILTILGGHIYIYICIYICALFLHHNWTKPYNLLEFHLFLFSCDSYVICCNIPDHLVVQVKQFQISP